MMSGAIPPIAYSRTRNKAAAIVPTEQLRDLPEPRFRLVVGDVGGDAHLLFGHPELLDELGDRRVECGEPGDRSGTDLQRAVGDLGLHADLLDRVLQRSIASPPAMAPTISELTRSSSTGSSISLWATSVDRVHRFRGLERDGAVGERGETGPPGDVEDRRLRQVLVHAPHDLDLERRVHRRERVVEDQHPRLSHQGARQRDPLALPARHGEATVADDAVEPAELVDDLLGAGGAHRVDHRVVVDLAPRAEEQVVAQRRREEERLLGDDSDRLAQLCRVEVVERDAVERWPRPRRGR